MKIAVISTVFITFSQKTAEYLSLNKCVVFNSSCDYRVNEMFWYKTDIITFTLTANQTLDERNITLLIF